ncbi:MAG TPA: hypothetical protein VKY65_06510 [Alphaproteobacteria bacterium]|nr:hypothetical protein [Alphaproteobacteria bacterium]
MSLAMPSRASGLSGLRARLPTLAPPLAALVYPFLLQGFNASATTIAKSGGGAGTLPWIMAAVWLLLAFAVPAIALLVAMSLAELRAPSAAQLRAKRMALAAVAAPTLFTFIGVVLYMLHDPVPDTWFWVACWAIAIVMLLRADNEAPAAAPARPVPAPLRVAHGFSALAIIAIFLALHIANHLTGLVGPTTYDAVMKVFRHVYRTNLLQPILVALFFFQIGSGLYFVWRHTAAPSDRFRTFQIASGVYLAFYVLGHMDSVFIFARTYLGIDTGWNFATGAPTGLVKDPWNIRLVPHYWLGVFFVLSHLAAGARAVMISHRVSRVLADRFMIGGAVAAGLIATAIMLGMCGLRLHFA